MMVQARPMPRSALLVWLTAGFIPWLVLLVGCSVDKKVNPSFPLTLAQAKNELKQMRENPVRLRRPVVVLGGWGDVLGLPPAELARQLRLATGDDRIVSVGFGGCVTFDGCRERLLTRLRDLNPAQEDEWTGEVDVIGFSMGGIVARYAAMPADTPPQETADVLKPLRIATLYTICTPHRGAFLARYAPAGPLAIDMRPGSGFMQRLDDELADSPYPVFCYTRIHDSVVGASNAAPRDDGAWWVYPQAFSRAHMDAYKDPRIVADLARRLRGDKPYTTKPPAPIPDFTDEP